MGMFGVIIYLPLFMQGVLGVSATQSGNLLTPLMMGAVVGSFVSGQAVSRTGKYKAVAVAGSVLIAAGMILFARMDGATARTYVAFGMIVAGLGMGLVQPVYTIAVQNVAPRHQMGAATSSTIFFRSIGSTVGVAAFGSMMLTRYHARVCARGAGARAGRAADLLLEPAAAGADAAADRSERRADARRPRAAADALCRCAHVARRTACELIFFWSAVIMTLAVLLHLALRSEPLRGRAPEPEVPAH